jgi:hypothetical protein
MDTCQVPLAAAKAAKDVLLTSCSVMGLPTVGTAAPRVLKKCWKVAGWQLSPSWVPGYTRAAAALALVRDRNIRKLKRCGTASRTQWQR